MQRYSKRTRFITIKRIKTVLAMAIAALHGTVGISADMHNQVELDLPNQKNDSKLITAAREGAINEVKLLLSDLMIDPNEQGKDGDTALIVAVIEEQADVITTLLADPRIDPNIRNNYNNTAFFIAAGRGNVHAITILLADPRVDPNERCQDSMPALVLAAIEGKTASIMALLRDPRVDPNIGYGLDNTAFTAAAAFGKLDAVNIFLADPRINVNAKTDLGTTVLMAAAICNELDVVNALLADPRVDPNITNNRKFTALMMAARREHIDMVNVLLAHPMVDPGIRSICGDTAITLAAKRGNVDLANLLLLSKNAQFFLSNNVGFDNQQVEEINPEGFVHHSLYWSMMKQILKNPLSRSQYHAIILGNFISLRDILLPDESYYDDSNNFLFETFQIGAGFEGFSWIYLIETWHAFQSLPFKTEYSHLEIIIKTAFKKLITNWQHPQSFKNTNHELSVVIQRGEACSWLMSSELHTMGMSSNGNLLIFTNLGGFLSLDSGEIAEDQYNLLPGEMLFDTTNHKSLFTSEFIEKLRNVDAEALKTLYQLPKIGYIGKRGQTRGNCTFVHSKVFFENHIYFVLRENENKLPKAHHLFRREEWESTSEWNVVDMSTDQSFVLPSSETLKSLNQNSAVKHARRIFRDFTLFGRIKALANFANDPHMTDYIRTVLPEQHKDQAQRLVNDAVIEGWNRISTMIQKRTAYKAAEKPDWSRREYNTVDGGSIVEQLLIQLGSLPQTEAGRLLRQAIITTKSGS